MKLVAPVFFWFALTACAANAALIVVGDHELQPDTPGQSVQIQVSGRDAVQGLNFYVQVADGGPPAGGTVLAPRITSVDILGGTIFAANNEGQLDPGSLPQLAARTTTTISGNVLADGLLATLMLDTTGFTSGLWTLSLHDTLNGPTDFAGVPIAITDGTISIRIPEPGSTAIAACLCGLLRRGRRRINCTGLKA